MNSQMQSQLDTIFLENLQIDLPEVVQLHRENWLSSIQSGKGGFSHYFLGSIGFGCIITISDDFIQRIPRHVHEQPQPHPALMMKKSTKVRTCQNMAGILGGANAFNFLSFVAGVITLSK